MSMRRFQVLSSVAAAALAGAALAGAACSASGDGTELSSGTDNAAGTAGGDSSTGGGGMGGMFNPTSSGGNQGIGGEETCLATAAEAQQKPLDMVIIWDRSGSMSGAKWNGTVSAVTQFVNDPASDGMSVGINFFPLDSASDQCDPAIHNPPQLPLTLLPAGSQTVVDTINATNPSGLTPTHGAMWGTLQFLTAHQDANPDHVVIAILASDGDPSECETNNGVIAGLASSALNYNGVRTYAIAIAGSSVAALNQIAMAGGTGQAFDVTSDISLFQQKMEEIRASALGCDYAIPEPGENEEFDPTKLNITYTPGDMGAEQTLPQATSEADCGNGPGWYYDNNDNPSRVFLCPASCAQISNDAGAQVDFQFGCPTILN